jgi:hypothetical protein
MIAGLLAMVLLTATGCVDKKHVPSGILAGEKMESLLWDMVQADQYSALYLAKDSAHIDLKTENLKLYDEVFRLHNVSREEFRKSYQYYLDHPEVAQTLFDSLLARGNRLRSEAYSHPIAPRPLSKPAVPPPATPPAALPMSPLKSALTSRLKARQDSIRMKFRLDSIRLKVHQDSIRLKVRQDSVARSRAQHHLHS